MIDPEELHELASHIILHAWVHQYLRGRRGAANPDLAHFSARLGDQALRLRESAVQLQAALEKMRVANEKLAARMAEHRAFFAKYQTPD
jgi:DNA anti-recombination protein RmuC